MDKLEDIQLSKDLEIESKIIRQMDHEAKNCTLITLPLKLISIS